MRTTIDLPDDLFRRAKSAAVLRGASIRDFVIQALEREVDGPQEPGAVLPVRPEELPLIRRRGDHTIDLRGLDLDDLLA